MDKTGLLCYINSVISTPNKLVCVSRPRRFGKSFAVSMLCAYYDKSCDSSLLFQGLEISKSTTFKDNLNKHNIIQLDIAGFISQAKREKRNVLDVIQSEVIEELREYFPQCFRESDSVIQLSKALYQISVITNEKFIFLIDEYDVIFRETKYDEDLQKNYINLLKELFENDIMTEKVIATAYITGILPVRKYNMKSALISFNEFTMTLPKELVRYVDFTEDGVENLCSKYDMDINEIKEWYAGYHFKDIGIIYNPNSIMKSIKMSVYNNYWAMSGTYISLVEYIMMNINGLRDAIISLLNGIRIRVNTSTFQNDIVNLRSKDDILTLLIHLGYLTYDPELNEIYIYIYTK